LFTFSFSGSISLTKSSRRISFIVFGPGLSFELNVYPWLPKRSPKISPPDLGGAFVVSDSMFIPL